VRAGEAAANRVQVAPRAGAGEGQPSRVPAALRKKSRSPRKKKQVSKNQKRNLPKSQAEAAEVEPKNSAGCTFEKQEK